MSDTVERVNRAIEAYREGKMVILVDDEDRENEGDLCVAAEKVTPSAINFMATHGRGLICLALDDAHIERLQLPMMVQDNRASLGTAFTVSIEARRGVTTGISAKDRATTILAAIDPEAKPDDLVSPGHIFPLRARPGGVLVRTGQTEGSVDLAKLAGLSPSSVICEIMRDDGEMARMPDLEEFSRRHDIMILSVADLISYRLQRERIVQRLGSAEVRPPVLGAGEPFTAYSYSAEVEDTEYMVLVRGDVAAASSRGEAVLVRVQAMCPVGDPFGIRPEMLSVLRTIDEAKLGVFLYVYNKQRTSLHASFSRYVLQQEKASDRKIEKTGEKNKVVAAQSEALRDFGLGAQVLADIGCQRIKLMSNSERKIVGIEGFGMEVVERVPIARSPAVPAVAATTPLLRPIEGGRDKTAGRAAGEHEESSS